MKNSIKVHDKKIERADRKLVKKQKELVKLRRARPRELVEDATFASANGPVQLSALFDGKSDLILIHNMGKQCRYCTMWADGFNGIYEHLADRAAFCVISYDPPEMQKKFATSRNWRFPMVSGYQNTFIARMGFGTPDDRWPGVSTFVRRSSSKIYRVAHARFGPFDSFCGVWPLIGMLDKGVNDWEPQYRY